MTNTEARINALNVASKRISQRRHEAKIAGWVAPEYLRGMSEACRIIGTLKSELRATRKETA